MPSWKLNMTLKRFIIFSFLTLDIGLFVQPYPFDPLEGALLIQACLFSLRVDCSGEQTDKSKCETWREDDVCVYMRKKDGEGYAKRSQNAFRCHTKQEICCIYLWWNTTALCRECCLMSEQLNLSWCNSSHRNFSHRTASESDSLQMWNSRGGKKTTALK